MSPIPTPFRVSHSRPYHPQTQGKDERFHRPLKAELLGLHPWRTLAECQARFEPWRLPIVDTPSR